MIYPHIKYIQKLLEKYQLSPLKHLGQNFLIDKLMAEKIYRSFDIQKGDAVLEVGPGFGAMTFFFLQNTDISLTTIEIDRGIVSYLKDIRTEYGWTNKWEIIHADILRCPWENIFPQKRPYKLLSNLPFCITGPFLMKVLQNKQHISRVVLLLQEEVVKKILAHEHSKEYNRLAIYFAVWSSVHKIVDVSPVCFYPSPKVSSSVIRIDFKDCSSAIDDEIFMKVVSTAFGQRRKMIVQSLQKLCYNGRFFTRKDVEFLLDSAHIDSSKRPQELCASDFVQMSLVLQDMVATNRRGV